MKQGNQDGAPRPLVRWQRTTRELELVIAVPSAIPQLVHGVVDRTAATLSAMLTGPAHPATWRVSGGPRGR
jgi:hypothetical protein